MLAVNQVVTTLTKTEANLISGWVIESQKIDGFLALEPPWGHLIHSSVVDLRKQGAALLPTLRRIRDCAELHREAIQKTQARVSQAWTQAVLGVALIPLLGFLWPVVMTELQGLSEWLWGVALASIWGLLALAWMGSQIQRAQFGGLCFEERDWIVRAPVAGERLLSALRAGLTPDLAWIRATELFPGWRRELFQGFETHSQKQSLRVSILQVGQELNASIQWAQWEGRPCQDQIEAQLRALRGEIEQALEKESQLLASRALLPLFVFVAPAVLGLLGGSLWLVVLRGSI